MKKLKFFLICLGIAILTNSIESSLPDQSVFDFVLNKVTIEKLHFQFSLLQLYVKKYSCFLGKQPDYISNNSKGEDETSSEK